MAHQAPKYHVGDRVIHCEGQRCTITKSIETPLGWHYYVDNGGPYWYAEHVFTPARLQWNRTPLGHRVTSGEWTVMDGRQLWFGPHLIGDFIDPYLTAEKTAELWDEARSS